MDPDEWWPVEWYENHAILKNRATQEIKEIGDIEGYCKDNVCRNIAGDEDDPTHDYVPQVNINMGGLYGQG